MGIDGSTVMWAFGLIFAAFSGLIGVIWSMLNRRLNNIEERMLQEKEDTRDTLEKIFEELKTIRECMKNIELASAGRLTECTKEFATKNNLNDGLNSIRREIRQGA